MKTIPQKIKEILKSGQTVRSSILGCMGVIEKVDRGGLLFLKKERHFGGGCFSLNRRMNDPQYALKRIKGQWILSNRKTWSRRMAQKAPVNTLAHAFSDYGI